MHTSVCIYGHTLSVCEGSGKVQTNSGDVVTPRQIGTGLSYPLSPFIVEAPVFHSYLYPLQSLEL